MRLAAALALLLVSCSGDGAEGRGGLSKTEADELNQAAATLDAQQAAATPEAER